MAMRDMSNREVVISIIGAFVATLLASFFSYTILSAEQTPIILAYLIALFQDLGISLVVIWYQP